LPVKRGRKTTPTVAELRDKVPHAPEAERSLLGAILTAPDPGIAVAGARRIVEVAEFFSERHRTIFETIITLSDKSKAIDLVTVKEELAARGTLELVGGPAFLGSLVDGAFRAGNVEAYARIVKDKAVRRGIMEHALLVARACTNGHQTPELVEAGGELYRQALSADPEARRRCQSTGELMDSLAAAANADRGRRILTHIPPIDRRTRGVAPGEVFTIVARPQVGKSALASKIALDAARSGERVVFFSLEMPRHQALLRLCQQALGVDDETVERLAEGRWKDLTPAHEAALAPVKERILIVDRGKSGIDHLDSSMTEAQAILGGAPRLAIIDYLGLLCSGAKNLPVYQRVSEAAIDCKSFAKRHQVALILLSQAGRETDRKKTDGAADLGIDAARDSGVVEESSDFLACLWRPWLSSALSPVERFGVKDELWIGLHKNRRGEPGKARLHFDTRTLHISDWPTAREDES
jgi:replicative DNA helicase